MSSEQPTEIKNNPTEILNNTIRTLFERVNREKSESHSESESSCSSNDEEHNRRWEVARNLAESQNYLCQMFLRLMEDTD